jgi:4-amino-4-deoxychorismate lyase
MNLVNGLECDVISLTDRGFNYGDGVFRTLALRDGWPRCWRRQYEKLHSDCDRLYIDCPSQTCFEADVRQIAQRYPNCTLKLTVTRGNGARGYAIPPVVSAPTRIVTAGASSVYPSQYQSGGIHVRLCRTRLARQPELGGVKHLNRLENVLARREWEDADIAEGLMCDTQGQVIGGTMSNLFIRLDEKLLTPDVTQCGVAGVQRARVLDFAAHRDMAVDITPFTIETLLDADEVFIVNSLIDAWQVSHFEGKKWRPGSLTPDIRQWLAADD